jgi:UDP-N-acetylmuramoyl-tripeptide--D-alanyl-D-alanine ligase
MIARPLSTIAGEVGGRLVGADVEVTHVVTDSRVARPGALFVALEGEHDHGVRFLDDAFGAGAVGAIVPEGTASAGPAILVASTGEALVQLGAAEARRSAARVVAVTGANGKTSTKDMTAAVASTRFVTHASPGSFNNEIGLPMTLLGSTADTEVIVAEMGARHRGDVAALCEIVRPSIVVVTNVGVAHMEIFGSWEAIVEAAAEPVDALDPDGCAVLNIDDPVVAGLGARHPGRVLTFGVHPDADVRATDVSIGDDGTASFTMHTSEGRARVALTVAGEHMVPNALAAAAVGSILGVPLLEIADALCSASVSRWRMETFTTPEGVVVINDAYNANPESMAAAMKTARAMARSGRMIAVLGHMAELGPIGDEEHERLGDLAARLRVDRLVAVGERARPIAVAAVREGLRPEDVASYDDVVDAVKDVRAEARSGDVVLVKGSRVAGLEAVAEALR